MMAALLALAACGQAADTASSTVTVTAAPVTVTVTTVASPDVTVADGQASTSSAATATGKTTAASTTGLPVPVASSVTVNRSFQFGYYRITVKDATYDPEGRGGVGAVTVSLTIENVGGGTGGDKRATLRLGDLDFPASGLTFDYPAQDGRTSGVDTFPLTKGVVPDWDDAVLYWGPPEMNRAVIPLGSSDEGTIDHAAVPFDITGTFAVGPETFTWLKAQVSPSTTVRNWLGQNAKAGQTLVQLQARYSESTEYGANTYDWSLRRPDGAVDDCTYEFEKAVAPVTFDGWVICETPEPASGTYTLIHHRDDATGEFPITIP